MGNRKRLAAPAALVRPSVRNWGHGVLADAPSLAREYTQIVELSKRIVGKRDDVSALVHVHDVFAPTSPRDEGATRPARGVRYLRDLQPRCNGITSARHLGCKV